MVLRWYTTVIDCHDVRKQAAWWAEALGWKTIYETDGECVNIPGWVDEDIARTTPWERIGPGMVFVPVPEGKTVKNRLHLDVRPPDGSDQATELERLLGLGATEVDDRRNDDGTGWVVLADPEGNEFCILRSMDEVLAGPIA